MGIFDFLKNSGRDAKEQQELAEEIRVKLRDTLKGHFQEPRVSLQDGTVTLYGTADSDSAREKAVLIAGNYKGVERVNDDNVKVNRQASASSGPAPMQKANFYTIEKGDTLSKIAQEKYGDASKWRALFDANKEVIEDPDMIYPGQQIRIPANV